MSPMGPPFQPLSPLLGAREQGQRAALRQCGRALAGPREDGCHRARPELGDTLTWPGDKHKCHLPEPTGPLPWCPQQQEVNGKPKDGEPPPCVPGSAGPPRPAPSLPSSPLPGSRSSHLTPGLALLPDSLCDPLLRINFELFLLPCMPPQKNSRQHCEPLIRRRVYYFYDFSGSAR